MSVHAHDHHADAHHVAPPLAANKTDPTRTKSLRDQYSAQLYKRYRALKGGVRRIVEDADWFDLTARHGTIRAQVRKPTPRPPPNIKPPATPGYQYPTDDRRIQAFADWLEDESNRVVMGGRPGSLWTDDYVRYAYGKGVKHADANLRNAGMNVPTRDLADTFNMPVHQDTLQLFYRRQYTGLRGINAEVSKQVSRTLSEGFLEGVNPRETARRVNDRVSNVGITRARTLARTETVWAHNEAALNRYQESMGPNGEVRLLAEYVTAGDDRVCEQCASLEGAVFKIKNARNVIPQHPRCRCTWTPVTSASS